MIGSLADLFFLEFTKIPLDKTGRTAEYIYTTWMVLLTPASLENAPFTKTRKIDGLMLTRSLEASPVTMESPMRGSCIKQLNLNLGLRRSAGGPLLLELGHVSSTSCGVSWCGSCCR